MKITINGTIKEFKDNLTLNKIISSLSLAGSHIIAEVNGKIIKTDFWQETKIKNGDLIELVTFVGGG